MNLRATLASSAWRKLPNAARLIACFAAILSCVSIAPGSVGAVDLAYHIQPGAPVLAPFQHIRFCLRYPQECSANEIGSDVLAHSKQAIDLLDRVNSDVNASIAPRMKNYEVDVSERWTLNPSQGDCNDYAVSKRRALVEKGVPAGSMRLAAVKIASGLDHLVLVVSTTKGDYVLDNLAKRVVRWDSLDYRWLKIQSSHDPRLWRLPAGLTRPAEMARL